MGLIRGAYLCSPVPMFPGTYVPRYLCSPVPMFPGTYVPRTYVPRYLCSPVPMFPEPMFPGTYVPRYLCSPIFRLIFLSLQIVMNIHVVIFAHERTKSSANSIAQDVLVIAFSAKTSMIIMKRSELSTWVRFLTSVQLLKITSHPVYC